jgi:hypothetical protein
VPSDKRVRSPLRSKIFVTLLISPRSLYYFTFLEVLPLGDSV